MKQMPILKVKTKTEFKKKLKQDTVPPECPELVGVLWTPKIGTRALAHCQMAALTASS